MMRAQQIDTRPATRNVPPDHPNSNYRMAHKVMLSHVPVPPANVHRIQTENPDAGTAADVYP